MTMGRLPPTHVDDPAAVGRRIREAREAKGLSLREIAFPGCSPSFLSRVESGARVPGRPVLAELAQRLDVSVDALAGVPQDGRIPGWKVSHVELEVRLGSEGAEVAVDNLLAEARVLGDTHAVSRALEALGHIAVADRRDQEAIAFFEEAREADLSVSARTRPALFQALGRAYAGAGDMGRAISVLQGAFDDALTEPIDVPLLVRLGSYLANAYTDQGHFAQAEQTLATLLRHEKQMTDVLSLVRMDFALARTYAEEGRSALAERYSRRVLGRLERSEEQETLGRAHLLLAEILLDRRETGDAEAHLEVAAELMGPTVAPPEMALITVERGRAAVQRGEIAEADRLAREALSETEATEPGIAGTAYTLLARAAFERGEYDEARRHCAEAIEQIPGRSAPHHVKEVYELLSEIEEAAGDMPAALEAARRAAGLAAAERTAD
jgi:tetratricopeptide (TPR) repeat protein